MYSFVSYGLPQELLVGAGTGGSFPTGRGRAEPKLTKRNYELCAVGVMRCERLNVRGRLLWELVRSSSQEYLNTRYPSLFYMYLEFSTIFRNQS